MTKYLLILIVLIVLIAILLTYQGRKSEKNLFMIYSEEGSFSVEDWQQFKTDTLEIGSGKKLPAVFLPQILDDFKIEIKGIKALKFNSIEGSSIIIPASELTQLYLTLDEDETLRLIIPDDQFRQRWLKNLISLEIE